MAKISFSATCALIIVCLLGVSLAQSPEFWPEKECKVKEDCGNTTTGLACLSDKCGCDQTLFDVEFSFGSKGECVLPLGGKCEGTNGKVAPPAAVTPGAECKAGDVVKCKADFEKSPSNDKKCIRSAGSACTTNTDCEEEKFLTCEGLTSDPTTAKCDCTAGSTKDTTGKCQLNLKSTCNAKNPLYPQIECGSLTECKEGKCACSPGLEENSKGECRVPHDGDCSKGATLAPCDQFQECGTAPSPQQCKCKGEGVTTWFNSGKKVCETLIGGTCNLGEPSCTESTHGECKGNEGAKTCACKDALNLTPSLDKKTCYSLKGAKCNNGDSALPKCNSDEFHGCNAATGDGQCDCLNKDNVWYDEVSKKCLLKATRLCELGKGKQSCVANSECKELIGGTKICQCNDKMAADSNGLCKVDYDGDCSNVETSPCNGEKFLECQAVGSDRKCRCQGEGVTTWYDSHLKQCLLLANKPCEIGSGKQSCVANSECKTVSSKNICQCKDNMGVGSDGFCKVAYNGDCSKVDSPCDSDKFLECNSDKKCKCKGEGVTTWFNTEKKVCETLIGGTCKAGEPSCTELTHGECKNVGGTLTCQCKDNLIPSLNKQTCYSAKDSQCNNDVPTVPKCNADEFQGCSVSSGAGTCDCLNKDNIWYDTVNRKCLLRANKPCETGTGKQACVANSECKKVSDNNICQCKDSMVADSKGLCKVAYAGDCSKGEVNSPCDSEKFLECNPDKKCQCKGEGVTTWYNTAKGTCETLIDAPCTTTTAAAPCGGFASCKTANGALKCTCNDNLFPSLDKKTCYGVKDIACNTGDPLIPKCNPEAYLECSAAKGAGTCRCINPTNTWYDTVSKKCFVRANKPCETGKQSCVAQSECKTDNGDYVCQCNDNLAADSNGFCSLSYNGDCSKGAESPCDTGKFLECKTEGSAKTCKCKGEGVTTWYNSEKQVCETLIGGTCSDSEAPCAETKFGSCVVQGSFKKCGCNANHTPSLDKKTCQTAFGATCNNADNNVADCSAAQFLTCSVLNGNGKCECVDAENSWYDTVSKKCYLLSDAECQLDVPNPQPCVKNSKCTQAGPRKAICLCDGRLEPNANKQCKLWHGASCDPKQDLCDNEANQKCDATRTSCDCSDLTKMKFENGSCKLKAGQTCTLNGQGCVQNSTCKAAVKPPNGLVCTCDGALTANKNGACVGKHDASCTGNQDCDGDNFLTCAGGKCACSDQNNMNYNEKDETCYLKLDSACAVENGKPKCEPSFLECLGNQCECSETLGLISEGNTCTIPEYDATCVPEGEIKCSPNANLLCEGNKCKCYPSYSLVENETVHSCLGNLNSNCADDSDCNNQQYLVCNTEAQKCQCEDGLDYNEEMKRCNGAQSLALNFAIVLIALIAFFYKN